MCVVKVGNSKSIQCHVLCNLWFHKNCVIMTTVENNAFAGEANKKCLFGRDNYEKPENTLLGMVGSKLDITPKRFFLRLKMISLTSPIALIISHLRFKMSLSSLKN